MVEHPAVNRRVVGSSPTAGAIFTNTHWGLSGIKTEVLFFFILPNSTPERRSKFLSVPSKAYIIQLVQVQLEERLAIASEPSPALDGVIYHREARRMGIPSHTVREGIEPRNYCRVSSRYCSFSRRQNSHNHYWRDYASPTGSFDRSEASKG